MLLRKTISRANVVTVFAFSFLWAQATFAAEPTATELAVARRLFAEASTLEQEQKWAAAAQKLREAIAIKETPGLRFHLARCEEEQGLLVEALIDYDRAAELIQAGANAPDVQKILPETRKSVQARIPSIVIQVPPDVSDVTISIDGKTVAGVIVGQPAPLNPGRYRLQVTAPGRKPFQQEVSLNEGQKRQINAVLPPETQTQGAPPPATAKPQRQTNLAPDTVDTSNPNTLRTIAIASEIAVAAIGLGIGIGFKVAEGSASDDASEKRKEIDASLGPNEDRNSACAPGSSTANPQRLALCAEAESAEEDRSRFSNIATAGFIGAGVGAAALGLTLLLWPSSSNKSSARIHALPLDSGFAAGFSGVF